MVDGLIFKHNDYYHFAVASWNEWLSANIELAELCGTEQPDINSILENAKKDWGKFHELLRMQAMASTSYVIYCALYLEAYINFYGVSNNIPNIRDYESSLSIKNKWRIYPQIVTGKQISGDAIKTLGVIFGRRDDIVHLKPRTEKAKHKALLIEDSLELINGVNFIRRELAKIDPNEPWNGEDFEMPEGINGLQIEMTYISRGKQ